MALPGEGHFNLNILKEITAKDSFLELDSDVIKFKTYEVEDSYDNCTTRYISEQMMQICKCLPFAIINNGAINGDKVC